MPIINQSSPFRRRFSQSSSPGGFVNPNLGARFRPPNISLSSQPSNDEIEYNNEGPATKAFRDFLATSVPSREQFKPSKTQRLAAILSGLGAGIRNPSAGPQAAYDVLDRPYQQEMERFQLRGEQLAKAADLEQRTSATGLRNFIDVSRLTKDLQTENRLQGTAEAQMKNYQSLIDERGRRLITEGWSPRLNEMTGVLEYHRINPITGQPETRGGNKIGQSIEEETKSEIGKAGRLSDITLGRQKKYFDFANPQITGRQESLARLNNQLISDRQERTRLAQEARDAKNPNREIAAKRLVLMEIIEQYPNYSDDIDLESGTFNSESRYASNIRNLINQKLRQRGFGSEAGLDPRIVR